MRKFLLAFVVLMVSILSEAAPVERTAREISGFYVGPLAPARPVLTFSPFVKMADFAVPIKARSLRVRFTALPNGRPASIKELRDLALPAN